VLARRNAKIPRRRKEGFVLHNEEIRIAAFGNRAIDRAEASIVEQCGLRVGLEVFRRDVVQAMVGPSARRALRE